MASDQELAGLSEDLPPEEVMRAASLVSQWMAANNIKDWALDGCASREWQERLARENAESDDSLSRAIDERDAAQDALSTAHIELGGDGEWVCKMGAAADSPPNSGDLVLDVPALASKVRARAERAEAELAAMKRSQHGTVQAVRPQADGCYVVEVRCDSAGVASLFSQRVALLPVGGE